MQHPVCCVQSRLRSGIPQRLESGYLPEKFKPRSHERGFFCLSPHLVATRSLREKVEEAQLVGDEKAPYGVSTKTASANCNALGLFLRALYADSFLVEARVTVRPSAQPTLLDQNDVILLTRDATRYAGEFSTHMDISFARGRSGTRGPSRREAARLAP